MALLCQECALTQRRFRFSIDVVSVPRCFECAGAFQDTGFVAIGQPGRRLHSCRRARPSAPDLPES